MGYNLTIDQGNSATKAVVWHDSQIVSECSCKCLLPAFVKKIIDTYGIKAAIYSSVSSRGQDIVETLQLLIGKSNVINLSHSTPLPIMIDYATPETLGLDRIAAAVGAFAAFPRQTILVVDLGTAATYDVVTADARFAGGNIAPGVKMRFDALHQFTARLPLVNASGDCPLWGTNTETAIRSGVLNGIAAEITHYKSQLPDSAKVVLTGGWATCIEQMLNFKVEVNPHLVNIGLNCILQYNEKTI